MYYQNGMPLRIGKAFTYMDIQYPSNWLQLSTEAERAAINIVWVNDPPRADDRFYWNGDINMPKLLELVLNNGRDPVSGKQLGPQTGEADTFKRLRGGRVQVRGALVRPYARRDGFLVSGQVGKKGNLYVLT